MRVSNEKSKMAACLHQRDQWWVKFFNYYFSILEEYSRQISSNNHVTVKTAARSTEVFLNVVTATLVSTSNYTEKENLARAIFLSHFSLLELTAVLLIFFHWLQHCSVSRIELFKLEVRPSCLCGCTRSAGCAE